MGDGAIASRFGKPKQYRKAGRTRWISHGLQFGVQGIAPVGVHALHAAQMSHVVSIVHEFGCCQLYGRAWGRRKAHDCLGKLRNQRGWRDDEAKSQRGTDRLAERTDVDDATGTVQRCQGRGRTSLQLEFPEVVILDNPRSGARRPFDQLKSPGKRQGDSGWRLLAGRHQCQGGIGRILHAKSDIDPVVVNGYRDRSELSDF